MRAADRVPTLEGCVLHGAPRTGGRESAAMSGQVRAGAALDRRLGDRLDRLVGDHHRRRLARLGWSQALDPAAAMHDTPVHPVREGNSLRVHIDGRDALAAMAEQIAGARSWVHIAGWFASPDFRLVREPGAPALRDLLAGVAERVPVRLLLWAGPPLPLFKPTRRMAEQACAGFSRGTRVLCALDRRGRTMHCHHEKLVVVDGRVAFVGGIDLTDLAGDRWDSQEHRPDRTLGWHDAAAQLEGPIVADVADHFAHRWREITGEPLAPAAVPPAAGATPVQFARTVPERTYRFAPRGDFSIIEHYARALASARSLIYLENQFLWSTEIVGILADKLGDPPSRDFRLLLVLPARPSNGADTTRGQLSRLIAADAGRGRLLAATLDAHTPQATGPLYVHAKVAVVDDNWLTLGSANLNEHSLFNDTEVNVVVPDPAAARDTRIRLWSEHLGRPVRELGGDPTRIIDGLWRPIAEEQAGRIRLGRPRTHRITLLPGVSRRAERLQGPLRGLVVDA